MAHRRISQDVIEGTRGAFIRSKMNAFNRLMQLMSTSSSRFYCNIVSTSLGAFIGEAIPSSAEQLACRWERIRQFRPR